VFAFVLLGLVPLVLSQEIVSEECLQNDLFCVEWYINFDLLVSTVGSDTNPCALAVHHAH